MDLFMPSKQTLEKISECSKKFTYLHHILPKNLHEKYLENLLCASTSGLGKFVGEFYNLGLNFLDKFNCHEFSLVFLEGIRNALAHGHSNKKFVTYGLFLGDKGICQGFNDGGDYFKDRKIKQIWENKQPITKFGKELKCLSGGHFGVNEAIFPYSDSIDVDTTNGTLYCIQSHKTLKINPGKLY